MNLIEEAVVIELFGIRMYAFGVYVALGVLCAMIVLAVCGRIMNMKAGTAALSACLGTVCGFVFSRIVFCLLNQELDSLTPLSVWPQVSGGGWSMFGLIIGAYFGGWISARIMKEKPGKKWEGFIKAVGGALITAFVTYLFTKYYYQIPTP